MASSNYRTLVSRATEGTEAPTPGYLYVDLCKAATGNPTAAQDMVGLLTRRLATKQNPTIKYKCLKVLTKLCEGVPRNAFRRFVAQDHEGITAIKESMNFRGTPDPVRGDTHNEKVRVAAKECLDAVYREAPTSETSSTHTHPNAAMMTMNNHNNHNGNGYGGVSSSYGAPPHAAGGGAYNGLPSRMQGIGNPMFKDPRLEPEVTPTQALQNVVKEASEVIVGMIKDPLARNVPMPEPPRHSTGSYGGPTYGRPPPGAADLVRQTGGEWTMASNRGPGAIDYQRPSQSSAPPPAYPASSSTSSIPGTVGGSWGQSNAHTRPSITVNHQPQRQPQSHYPNAAVSDGTYEKSLVLELCPPGGVKPVPPPDKLASFARSIPNLSPDLICPILLDCLEDGQPWIIRAKALVAIETALQAGGDPYQTFFHACHEEIAPLTTHARPAIAEPATRVMALLGLAPGTTTPAVHQAAPPVASLPPPPNLMDFGDDDYQQPPPVPPAAAPPVTSAAPVPAPALTASGGGDMFGGMQLKAPAAATATAVAPSLLDFDVGATAPGPSPVGTADVFSNPAAMPSNIASTPAPTQPVPMVDMFGHLSVKNDLPPSTAVEALPAAAVASSSSAFGFINQTEGATAATSTTTTRPVFDPLSLGSPTMTPASPNSSSKRMTMSPEQIQAMMYQQMRMQQMMMHTHPQQQMQMAAMAMQMQSSGSAGHHHHPPLLFPTTAGGVGGNPLASAVARGGGGMVGPVVVGGPFSFAPPPSAVMKPVKMDDKKFDFVKDAMQTAGSKK